jgi:hypothetical protein
MLLWSLTSLAIDLFEHRLVFRDFWQDWLIASGAIPHSGRVCDRSRRPAASPRGIAGW